MDLNTFYVIGGFAAIVLAPVIAATFIGMRTKKSRESGSHKVFQVNDPVPPRTSQHLRPRPRSRRRR